VGNPKAKAVSIRGVAVFRGDRFAGWLDRDETRGVLWVTGQLKKGITMLPCPDSKKGLVGLQLTKGSSQLSPGMKNGRPQITVKIAAEAVIGEITCPELHLSSQQYERLNRSMEEQIRKDVSKALAKAKDKLQSDIFHFGKTFYMYQPKLWDRLAPDWHNGGLKSLEVMVEVKAVIKRAGLQYDPPKSDESR
jgi:spore germination protein KC